MLSWFKKTLRWCQTKRSITLPLLLLLLVNVVVAGPVLSSTLTSSNNDRGQRKNPTFIVSMNQQRHEEMIINSFDDWNYKQLPRDNEPTLIPVNRTTVSSAVSHNGDSNITHQNATTNSRRLWALDTLTGATSHLLYSYAASDAMTSNTGSGNTNNLPNFVDKALKLFNLRQVAYELETSVMSKVSCTACKAGAGLLQHYIRTGKSKDEIIKTIYQFCVSLKIQTARVCDGVSQLFGGEVIYVLKRITIGPDEICSFVIGDACGDVYNPYHEWEVSFPPVPKPPHVPHRPPKPPANHTALQDTGTAGVAASDHDENANTNTNSGSDNNRGPVFKVLHVSDTHYDPYYAEGSNADCNEPLCCRLTNGPAASPGAGAGKWGDYRKCDTPKRTVDHMLKHITETHTDIDYILWTGDLPPHDVWNQTREENLKILRDTVKQMSDVFPGIPIFPALGNHESAPVNSFPPPYVQQVDSTISWLYDELDTQWRLWLPQSVSHTVRRGAFYSVLVRPGFRIISLNTNYCNNKNWWLLLNSTDPATELQWFIYELQSAEFSGEKVHVIGHIPPGHPDCLKVWSRNYYRIVSRYESTITAQFFGHTHFDEFEVFYDPDELTRAVSIAYVGPSVSPYYDLNPGYRIYYVDGDHDKSTRMVLDHESWIMNLKEANLYDYPIWYKLYSAKSSYEMKALQPRDWDELIDRMAIDQNLFDLYYKHYWKNSPVRPAQCDVTTCRKRLLCDARSGRSHARRALCETLEARIDESGSGLGSNVGGQSSNGWRDWFYRGFTASVLRLNWLLLGARNNIQNEITTATTTTIKPNDSEDDEWAWW